MKLVFDLEANGLFGTATKVWCIVCKDLRTDEVVKFTPSEIEEGLEYLSKAKILIGHNICGYDLPLLEQLYRFVPNGKIRDTLCMSKLFFPERPSHSLDSYGKEFKRFKPVHEDWSVYSEEMLHRCSEDVEINAELYTYLVDKECKDWDWVEAIELEQSFAYEQAWQELAGVDIDLTAALELRDEIDAKVDKLDVELYKQLPLKVVNKGPVNKPFKKDGTFSKMVLDWEEVCNAID